MASSECDASNALAVDANATTNDSSSNGPAVDEYRTECCSVPATSTVVPSCSTDARHGSVTNVSIANAATNAITNDYAYAAADAITNGNGHVATNAIAYGDANATARLCNATDGSSSNATHAAATDATNDAATRLDSNGSVSSRI